MSSSLGEKALHAHLKTVMRNYREAKGWSQTEAGRYLGLSKAVYEKYEQLNQRKIPLIVLVDFCKLAGFTLDELINGAEAARRQAKRKGEP